MLVLSLRSTAPARHTRYLILALRRLRTCGLRRELSVPIATIGEANLLRHNAYSVCGAAGGHLLVSYTTVAPSWLEIEEATLAVRLQLLHIESTGLHS